jgi:hypothetical protein
MNTRTDIFFNHPDNNGNSGNISDMIIEVIRETKKELNLAMYRFLNKDLMDLIIHKVEDGISLNIIFDSQMDFDMEDYFIENIADPLKKLKEKFPDRVNIKFMDNSFVMHHKILIADRKILLTGSYNYTLAANFKNHENIIKVHASDFPSLVYKACAEFFRMMGEKMEIRPLKIKRIRLVPTIVLDNVAYELEHRDEIILKKGMCVKIEVEGKNIYQCELINANGKCFVFSNAEGLYEPVRSENIRINIYGMDGTLQTSDYYIHVNPWNIPMSKAFIEYLDSRYELLIQYMEKKLKTSKKYSYEKL